MPKSRNNKLPRLAALWKSLPKKSQNALLRAGLFSVEPEVPTPVPCIAGADHLGYRQSPKTDASQRGECVRRDCMTANLLPNPSAASTRQSLGYPTDSYRLRHRLFAG